MVGGSAPDPVKAAIAAYSTLTFQQAMDLSNATRADARAAAHEAYQGGDAADNRRAPPAPPVIGTPAEMATGTVRGEEISDGAFPGTFAAQSQSAENLRVGPGEWQAEGTEQNSPPPAVAAAPAADVAVSGQAADEPAPLNAVLARMRQFKQSPQNAPRVSPPEPPQMHQTDIRDSFVIDNCTQWVKK